MNYFIYLLIIILVVIYMYRFITNNENFVSGYDSNDILNEPVNYTIKKQNCNELTYSPTKCDIDTVIPSNNIVCIKSLNPITNNEIDYDKKKPKKYNNPTLSFAHDYDLLSSLNNNQLDNNNKIQQNNNNDELQTFDDLKTDVKSLNSIENDIMSNY